MTKASANPTPANWFRQGSAIMRLLVIQKAPDVENCRLFLNSLSCSWFWGVGKVLKMLLLFPTVHREERQEKARSKLLTTLLPVYSMSNWKPKSCSEKMRRQRQQSPFKSCSWEPRHLSPPCLWGGQEQGHTLLPEWYHTVKSPNMELWAWGTVWSSNNKRTEIKRTGVLRLGFGFFWGEGSGGRFMWIKALSLVCCDFCLHTIHYFQIVGQLLSIQKSNWNIRKCFMKFSMIEYMFKSQIKLHYTIRKSKKRFKPATSLCKCVWTTEQIIKTFLTFIIWMSHWTIEWFTS